MNEHLTIYPIIVHLITAVLLLFFWKKPKIQRYISILGSTVGIVIAGMLFHRVWENGILSIQLGNWEAPFGISMVADTLAVTLIVLTNIVSFALSIYSTENMVSSRIKFGYYAIFHFLIMGLSGAFLTGDLFNLYVWFEVIIISSFVLLTIGGRKIQIEGAVKYFTLNMISSIIFLTGIAMVYGATGSLNMAELSRIIPEIENKGLMQTISLIFFIGFGVKSGVFPLYFWLPASYHTPPAAVSALFAGLLTKVGIYAMLRVFTLIFPLGETNQIILMIIAGLTMFFGGIGALVQKNILRVFSYLIICHIGFMVGGLSIFTQVAIVGAVMYMFHDIIVKATLYMMGGIMFRIFGNTKMEKMGGLMDNYPKLSFLFAIPLFALVGIPPLSGFWPKISLFSASYTANEIAMLVMFIFASLITLIIIAKVWNNVFSQNPESIETKSSFKYFKDFNFAEKAAYVVPVVLLVGVTLYYSFFAEHFQLIATRIGEELMNTEHYYNAVFNINEKTKL
ncbi:complex I subunit 5 family protein [Brumimicrobium aurantiacum]|uniref:Na+/H+ antiporter subunit D n=1 Tax=Brumimicrobium aurantiacum TaxID=1737063 RepID=A0A3E1EWT6_9FLAO|nr:proton-conducting transporter membrane subunit [Brumimicrobium aurantiacum]RFC54020.1 Na+/H+ antiporter subunit D [Brumimicrobium aurantiacum]